MGKALAGGDNPTGILTVDLHDYAPEQSFVVFDLKELLFHGLILKEKEFKEGLATMDWNQFQDQWVAVTCSEDAIIPPWAYMMVASKLHGLAARVQFGDAHALYVQAWQERLTQSDFSHLKGEKVVVRASPGLDPALYTAITHLLMPLVKGLMYGEAGLPKVIAKN